MKKFRFFLAMLAAMLVFGLAFVGCNSGINGQGKSPGDGRVADGGSFKAKILEFRENADYTYFLVEPLEGEAIKSIASRISFTSGTLDGIVVSIGDNITVWYDGYVRLSSPASITASRWSKLQ